MYNIFCVSSIQNKDNTEEIIKKKEKNLSPTTKIAT